jgi:hypothetical protein
MCCWKAISSQVPAQPQRRKIHVARQAASRVGRERDRDMCPRTEIRDEFFLFCFDVSLVFSSGIGGVISCVRKAPDLPSRTARFIVSSTGGGAGNAVTSHRQTRPAFRSRIRDDFGYMAWIERDKAA